MQVTPLDRKLGRAYWSLLMAVGVWEHRTYHDTLQDACERMEEYEDQWSAEQEAGITDKEFDGVFTLRFFPAVEVTT